jgi:hypothetical protein
LRFSDLIDRLEVGSSLIRLVLVLVVVVEVLVEEEDLEDFDMLFGSGDTELFPEEEEEKDFDMLFGSGDTELCPLSSFSRGSWRNTGAMVGLSLGWSARADVTAVAVFLVAEDDEKEEEDEDDITCGDTLWRDEATFDG